MLQGNITITRFLADARNVGFDAVERRAHHHLPVPSRPTEKTVRVGWCHPQNPLLPPTPDACKYEPWFYLGVRIDTWAAPGGRLKHELDKRKREWMAEMGRDRIPKAVIEDLRQQIYPDLAVPTTQHVAVVVHTQTGSIWLQSATGSVQASFEVLWNKSFPDAPISRYHHPYLGTSRFLLWVWYRTQHDDCDQVVGGATWSLSVDGRIEFEGNSVAATVKAGSADTSRPSFASLSAGMMPVKIRLMMSCPDGDFSALVSTPACELRSVKLPSPGDGEPSDRFEQIAGALKVIDSLATSYEDIVDDPASLVALEGGIDRWKDAWNRTLAPAP